MVECERVREGEGVKERERERDFRRFERKEKDKGRGETPCLGTGDVRPFMHVCMIVFVFER